MNPLIRQLKLHSLVGTKALTDPRVGLIHAFFDELFNGLQITIIPEYHPENMIFYKGETFYMEQDSDNGWLLCRYEGYWSFFAKDISMGFTETQAVIKYMVGKHLKLLIETPGICRTDHVEEVGKHLKLLVETPVPPFSSIPTLAGEHSKLLEETLYWADDTIDQAVGKHLKLLVETPYVCSGVQEIVLDKQLKNRQHKNTQ